MPSSQTTKLLFDPQAKWVYLASGAFVVLAMLGLITEKFWVLGIPFALLVVWFAIFRLDWLMLTITAFIPLGITLTDKQFNLGLSLPTEPLLFGVLCLVIGRFLLNGEVNVKLLKHPMSIAIWVYLLWMFLTTLTSSMPIVSLKYLIARLWFIIPFYVVMSQVFRKNAKNYDRFFALYLVSLCIAALYTIYVHSQYGFSKQASTWVMFPFYKEHTSWGAALAMYYPVSWVFLVRSKLSPAMRLAAGLAVGILTVALVLSYTRAAWVSLVAAGAVYVVVKFKVKWYFLVLAGIGVVLMGYANRDLILNKFSKNTQDSSEKLTEHVQSISNISTDASNLERINRWNSALRMFGERPLMGWGPGTYMFKYAPFQKPHEKTIISTNGGNRGNAHSEYIGPMAESGIFGLFTVLGIVVAFSVYGVKVYYQLESEKLRSLGMAALLGLVTYFTHGLLNNFLDMDKLSLPVWGFMAVIVSLDLYQKKAISQKKA
jgi:O-antigen ligase